MPAPLSLRSCASRRNAVALIFAACSPLLLATDSAALAERGQRITRPAEAAAPVLRVEPAALSFDAAPRPTIYVEIDWMEDGSHSHRPSAAVLEEVTATFAAAGYAIHLELSDAIPHAAVVDLTGPPSSSPAVDAVRDAYSDHRDDDRWHYSLWAHNYSWYGGVTSSSGYGDLPGRVHLVTLGSFPGETGTFSHQVGTFVHELGHNLGQRHGGTDNGNYKPNYLSVMNYLYQLDGIGVGLVGRGFAATASGFDDFGYSHGLLPVLDENSLDETRGLGLGTPIDWNCDGSTHGAVIHDLQARNHCTATGGFGRLADFDNWSSIAAFVRDGSAGESPPGSGAAGPPCTTWEAYRPQFERVQRLRARGALPADGPRLRRRAAAGRGAASFVLHNDGAAPVVVTGLALDTPTPWIQWEPQAPFTVAAGGSQRIYVQVALDQVPPGASARRLLILAGGESGTAESVVALAFAGSPAPTPTGARSGYYTVTPCRLLDTRDSAVLSASSDHDLIVTGSCGVPATARALALNVTAVAAGTGGALGLWPAGTVFPGTTSVAFGPSGARAASGVYGLPADGSGLLAMRSSAPVHLVLDVFGYFQ